MPPSYLSASNSYFWGMCSCMVEWEYLQFYLQQHNAIHFALPQPSAVPASLCKVQNFQGFLFSSQSGSPRFPRPQLSRSDVITGPAVGCGTDRRARMKPHV